MLFTHPKKLIYSLIKVNRLFLGVDKAIVLQVIRNKYNVHCVFRYDLNEYGGNLLKKHHYQFAFNLRLTLHNCPH